MDEPKHNQEKKPKLHVGFGIGLGEYSSSVLIGLISGILTAGKTIRDKFHDDVKNSTDIGAEMKKHAEKLSETPLNLDNASLLEDGTIIPTRNSFKKYADDIREKKKTQAEEIDKLILQKRGVRKSLLGGTFDRAGLMSKRSVNSILLRSLGGTIVGAVVTLGFFNGIATRAKINAIDDAVEPDLNQPPEQKAKSYKDRDSLETQAKAVAAKKEAAVKHADKIVEKIAAAKEERPASHVDKLAAAAEEQQELASAAR